MEELIALIILCVLFVGTPVLVSKTKTYKTELASTDEVLKFIKGSVLIFFSFTLVGVNVDFSNTMPHTLTMLVLMSIIGLFNISVMLVGVVLTVDATQKSIV